VNERLPFDPDKMAAPRRSVAPAADAAPWSVSRLAGEIDATLRRGVPAPVRVIGEVSGFRDRTHWYFDLKDEGAVVNCVLFANVARKINPPPRDGEQVVVKGRVEFYTKAGKVSFILESLERAGEGPLDRAFRELCATLKAEGYFAIERKKPLPRFPRRIAVITSRSAAALQDVIDTARRRCPAVGLVLVDVPVQGDAAAPEIARAIDRVSRHHQQLGVDAIILTRGGGSKEDLWCFNERAVADAIHRCTVPLVAAIGHETDTTIAELVADERCATPTQAAMRLTPDTSELLRQLDSTQRRLVTALARGAELASRDIDRAADRLESAALESVAALRTRAHQLEIRLERVRPQAQHARMIARVAAAEERLRRVMQSRLDPTRLRAAHDALARAIARRSRDAAASLDALDKHLAAISPKRVLERGFSITAAADGRLVRSVADVAAGDALTTHVADGTIASTVGEHAAPRTNQPVPRSRKARGPDPEEPGLFHGWNS
jgi:exodeoxyribonuclease VII large subunit